MAHTGDRVSFPTLPEIVCTDVIMRTMSIPRILYTGHGKLKSSAAFAIGSICAVHI